MKKFPLKAVPAEANPDRKEIVRSFQASDLLIPFYFSWRSTFMIFRLKRLIFPNQCEEVFAACLAIPSSIVH